MRYWLLYWWHIVTFAKKFRYEYSWGGWSVWCDYHYATLGLKNSTCYTGRVEYDPAAHPKRSKVEILHPTRRKA